MMKNLVTVALILFSSGYAAFAQNAPEDTTRTRSYLELSANYLSNAVYFGRKDEEAVSYIRPGVAYHHKSGLYADAGIAYLPAPPEERRIDLYTAGGGYDFSIGNKFDAGLYASKFFYNAASYAVGAELKGIAGVYAGFNTGIFTINAGGDLLFSQNTDYSVSLGLSKSVELESQHGSWTIAPAILANAGTQYFYDAYYEYRKYTVVTPAQGGGGTGTGTGGGTTSSGTTSGRGRSHKSGGGGGTTGSGTGTGTGTGGSTTTTTVTSVTTSYNNHFALLDYEISVPVKYEVQKWTFFCKPTYAIPQSPVNYAVDGQALVKESLSNSFFAEIGFNYKIR